MGTNYYIKNKFCEHCGRFDEIHLGKSSFGWKFCFDLNDKKFYRSYPELLDFIQDKKITDEYGREISIKDFLEMIKEKQNSTMNEEHILDIDGYSFVNCEFS